MVLALRFLEEIFRGLAALIAIVIIFFMMTGALADSPPLDPTDPSQPSPWSLKPLISVSVATVAALLMGVIRKVADDRAAPPPWAPVSWHAVAPIVAAIGACAARRYRTCAEVLPLSARRRRA